MEFKDLEIKKICLYDLIAIQLFLFVISFTSIHHLLPLIAEEGSIGLALAAMIVAVCSAWFQMRLGMIILKSIGLDKDE